MSDQVISKTKPQTQKSPKVELPKSKKKKVVPHGEISRTYLTEYTRTTIFCRGDYYRYKKGVWKKRNPHLIRREIKRLVFDARGDNYRSSDLKSIEDLVKTELFKNDDLLDQNDTLINMKNGIYDIETGILLKHYELSYFTTQLPFDYDENAKIDLWERYLATTFFTDPRDPENFGVGKTDKRLIQFVQEAVGYSLTSDNSFHIMFWLIGSGRNGKGVLFYILRQLGGDSVVPFDVNILGREDYHVANLAGKNIALCSESNAVNNLVEDAKVKQIVAGDLIQARQIRKEPFEMIPQCKLWWSMNKFPSVADTSEGFWRRIMIIPFNVIFQEDNIDRELKEKLTQELPAIFNWAMEGLQNLKDRDKFVVPNQVSNLVLKYRMESNTVQMFVEENCTKSPREKEQASPIYQEYRDWCLYNGYKPPSNKNFKERMEELGFWNRRGKKGNYYHGLKLEKPPIVLSQAEQLELDSFDPPDKQYPYNA